MSVNSQMNIERRFLHREFCREPSRNNPERKPPLTNDYLPSIESLNPLTVTQAGLYDRIVNVPKPVKPVRSWHRAPKGTVERFKGCLSDAFPELKELSDEDLKEIERKRH